MNKNRFTDSEVAVLSRGEAVGYSWFSLPNVLEYQLAAISLRFNGYLIISSDDSYNKNKQSYQIGDYIYCKLTDKGIGIIDHKLALWIDDCTDQNLDFSEVIPIPDDIIKQYVILMAVLKK